MHEQREFLVEEVYSVRTRKPNKDTLNELLYTAEQTGLIEPLNRQEAMFIYKLVKLAISYNSEPLNENLRM